MFFDETQDTKVHGSCGSTTVHTLSLWFVLRAVTLASRKGFAICFWWLVHTTKYVMERARRSQFPTCLPSQTGHVCEDNRSGGVAILMSLGKALRRFVVVSQELRFELAYHVLHKTR